jgi:hypothetical protein
MNARIAAIAMLVPVIASAQSQPRAPIVLLLPSSARALALGNTGVASRDDDVLFYNPAQLTVASGFTASGEYLSPTAGSAALSSVSRFNGTGGIALGVRLANYELPAGVIPATRANMLDAGTPGNSVEASIGYAQVIKGFRVGAAAKYAEDLVGDTRLGRPLLDLGVSHVYFSGYTFGAAVQNIGKDMATTTQVVQLPTLATVGVSHGWSAGEFDLYETAAVAVQRADFVSPSGGLEVNYSWLNGYNIALRAGGRRPMTGEQWFTSGAGFTMDRLTIDYGFETLARNRFGHRIGLTVR